MAQAAEAIYRPLDALPRELWLPGLICSAGATEPRLSQLLTWRQALEAGELPPADENLGDPEAFGALRGIIGELDLPRLCRGAPDMAEQVLRTALWHADRLIDRHEAEPRPTAIARLAEDFRAEWTIERGDWEEAQALLQGLGDRAHLRWDELRGHLRSRPWQEAQRLSALMAQRPELSALLRRIGRAERAVAPQPETPQAEDEGREESAGLMPVVTVIPGAPGEWLGLKFGDRLERMPGSEWSQLRHPVLHKLWRARRAEARLLNLDSQAVLVDWRPDPTRPPRRRLSRPQPERLERGPMILCLDTSGSMQGTAESIAKAVVLEAMRTAHREKRGCRLIAFGGPEEVIERDLAFTAAGLQALMDLMGQAFDGGTDVQAPIERAVDSVLHGGWHSADVLIVSDGEFGCTRATLERLEQARQERGLRVSGVLIGDRETMGLLEVCDEIHWVRDWRQEAPQPGRSGFSPVHSKSLTALFFPNALSERAARMAGGARPADPTPRS